MKIKIDQIRLDFDRIFLPEMIGINAIMALIRKKIAGIDKGIIPNSTTFSMIKIAPIIWKRNEIIIITAID
jgi:hypothetical protein